MKTLDPSLLAPESWRPALTHSGRLSNRTSERELDRIPALARLAAADTAAVEARVKLWDFSPGGFAILATSSGPGCLPAKAGDDLELHLDLGRSRVCARCQVVHSIPFRSGFRLGLVRTDIHPGRAFLASASAFTLPDACHVSGEVDNPILYGEGCLLRLAAVLPGPRFAFTTDDPTLALFRDQALAVTLALPSTGDLSVRGHIREIAQPSSGEIAFLLDPEEMSPGTLETLGNHLALDGRVQAGTLEALGFPAVIRGDSFEFRFAESREELHAARSLRDGLTPSPLWVAGPEVAAEDARKSSLRVLCVYHENRLAAAIGLEFPEGGEDHSGERRGTVQVRTVAVLPEFRRADLLLRVAARVGRAVLLSGRRRARWACGPEAFPLFRRLGFHPEAGEVRPGCPHVVLDQETLLAGHGMAAADWLPTYGGLRADLGRKGLLPAGGGPRLAARILQGLGAGVHRHLSERIEEDLNRILITLSEKSQ